jgi:hypothetical protein
MLPSHGSLNTPVHWGIVDSVWLGREEEGNGLTW